MSDSDDEAPVYKTELAARFGEFFKNLDSSEKSWVSAVLGEIFEKTTESQWKTDKEKYVQASVNLFQIICPNASCSITPEQDSERKIITFNWVESDPHMQEAIRDICSTFH